MRPPFSNQPAWAVQLAEALSAMRPKAQSSKAYHVATRCVLDYFASVLAGLSEPVSEETLKSIDMLGGNEMATILAHQGIEGSADAIEGRQGYYYTFGGELPENFILNDSKELALVSPGPGFKVHPCCTGAHPAVDTILMIQQKISA
jgi:2-methylcitrate dehydratase PrpD